MLPSNASLLSRRDSFTDVPDSMRLAAEAMNVKQIGQLVQKTVSAWIDDYAPSMGAALAYYTVFSIAPLLIIVIAVAGMVFDREAVRGEIAAQLAGLIGDEGAIAVQGLVKSASEPTHGTIATVTSVVLLVLGATSVFAELQSALDRIWRVPAKEVSGLWALLRARLLSFGMILGLGFMLLVSLVVSAAIAAFGARWGNMLGGEEALLQILNVAVSLGLSTGLFAMIYKVMPSVKIAWRDVWIGACVTAVLFEIGKILVGLYLGKSGVASGFGAAGSLVVMLVWVYYSAQIFLLGAEFTWVYAQERGSHAAEGPAETSPAAEDRSLAGISSR
jgi:membrane protein